MNVPSSYAAKTSNVPVSNQYLVKPAASNVAPVYIEGVVVPSPVTNSNFTMQGSITTSNGL